MSNRKILLVIHPTKPEALSFAIELARKLRGEGFTVLSQYSGSFSLNEEIAPLDTLEAVELVVVLGGDGTILRAAETIRGHEIPILGINMGNVGFLAEIDRPSIATVVDAISTKRYAGESRLFLKYEVVRDGAVVESGWALNEITIGRHDAQLIELFVQIDGRPLSRWGCDGVIAATPTGSTAYAFSAGGPVVWPEVNAIIFLPLAAHALYSRPMVISPDSTIAIDIESHRGDLSADGMRTCALILGDRVSITQDHSSIELMHLDEATFTDRLVAKFKLPIEGWRGE